MNTKNNNTYNIVHTIGNTYLGGVILDFMQLYQFVFTFFLVNIPPIYDVNNTLEADINVESIYIIKKIKKSYENINIYEQNDDEYIYIYDNENKTQYYIDKKYKNKLNMLYDIKKSKKQI